MLASAGWPAYAKADRLKVEDGSGADELALEEWMEVVVVEGDLVSLYRHIYCIVNKSSQEKLLLEWAEQRHVNLRHEVDEVVGSSCGGGSDIVGCEVERLCY